MATVFITGGSGYIGSRLIPELVTRGHAIRALVRPESKKKLPPGCEAVLGNALEAVTFASRVAGCDTFIHLVGVSNPSPAKTKEFFEIDLLSARASIEAAAAHSVRHFIYLSVAHPAPVMKAYIAVRSTCEEMIRERRMDATILRPWYVLGPQHRWPYVLLPFYKLAERFPATRSSAQRLGLVTIGEMIATLVDAVEHPARGILIAEVPAIRRGKTTPAALAAKAISD